MPTPAKPIGEPRQHDDDRLALILLIDDDDMEKADALWRDHAPEAYRGLLDGSWKWDARKQVYIDRHSGKFDGPHMKRLAVLFAASMRLDMQDKARDMATGITTLGAWEDRQAEDTKRLYLAMLMLADGGEDEVTQADRDRLTEAGATPDEAGWLRFSLARLQAFAADVADARANPLDVNGNLKAEATVEGIVNRAGMYALTGNGVYEEARTVSHSRAVNENGEPVFRYERNILGVADHCPECPELSALGWVPLFTLPPPGSRECAMNCYCSLEFSYYGIDGKP